MLTQDEAELYDRQIRLWGVNAQGRIRQSKVLMLGFNGVASEVAKILVLAGIDTLTIVDDKPLQQSDLTSNLFCRPKLDGETPAEEYRTYAVKAKLKTLNPLVKVNIDNSSILSKKPEEFKDYDLVTLHSFLSIDETSNINDICRKNMIKFYLVLDYGFFGFMFNDLGPEFKFTYEEFNSNLKIENSQTARQSGEEKDPISFSDEGIGDVDLDENESSGDEEDKPRKKKRRLHSPNRDAITKVVSEKTTVVGNLPYVSFQDMISLKSSAFNKQTSPILLLSIAMFKFYSQYKYLPRCDNTQVEQEDVTRLTEIIDDLKSSLDLVSNIFQRLDPDWTENIYGSLSPVCAILGGIAGQDMIRALSKKDIPINNTFAFDGIIMSGTVEKVGITDSKCLDAQPVVRDSVQID